MTKLRCFVFYNLSLDAFANLDRGHKVYWGELGNDSIISNILVLPHTIDLVTNRRDYSRDLESLKFFKNILIVPYDDRILDFETAFTSDIAQEEYIAKWGEDMASLAWVKT